MSAFEVKHMSEADAYKLEVAIRDEVESHEQSDPMVPATTMTSSDQANSQVADVLKEVVSHWIDEDEAVAERFAEAAGDEKLEHKLAGLSDLNAQPQGITGDFKADSAGPEEGIDTPPKMDGGEFGGGGGGGGGGEGGDASDWMELDHGAADVAAEVEAEENERGFDPGGGDDDDAGDGDEDDDGAGKKPAATGKPKK